MLTIPDYLVKFDGVRPSGYERYRSLRVAATIFNRDGKVILEGIVPFTTLDEIDIQLNELYNSGTSIRYELPMTNTMFRYTLYGGKIDYETYHIFIVRDSTQSSAEEPPIINMKLDGFDLSYLIYEFSKELMNINDANIDVP